MNWLAESVDRRTFFRRGIGVYLCAAIAPTLPRRRAWATAPLRLGVVTVASRTGNAGERAVAACARGIELGIDEAGRTARLLGSDVILAGRASDLATARALIDATSMSAVMCAANASGTAELADHATRRGILLLNALDPADALRNGRCARLAFHVCPSDAMRTDARRLWSADHQSDVEIVAWDPQLDRFGAAQLNARFAARFATPMDANAWAGWFAVKVVAEASQRARSVDAAAIAQYLERDATQFDGHKGVPLSFRHWDHQLRQPVYAVPTAGARSRPQVFANGPVALPPPTNAPARTALDALGTTEEGSTCRWS